MGCVWSGDERQILSCRVCGQKAVNNHIIIDRLCDICSNDSRRNQESITNRRASVPTASTSRTSAGPLYGKYHCPCGRTWTSRLSWANTYQVCKYCRRRVWAHNQRELRPSDKTRSANNLQEHPRELCQMCESLGRSCANRTNKYL